MNLLKSAKHILSVFQCLFSIFTDVLVFFNVGFVEFSFRVPLDMRLCGSTVSFVPFASSISFASSSFVQVHFFKYKAVSLSVLAVCLMCVFLFVGGGCTVSWSGTTGHFLFKVSVFCCAGNFALTCDYSLPLFSQSCVRAASQFGM